MDASDWEAMMNGQYGRLPENKAEPIQDELDPEPPRRISNSITGGEDTTDARLICVKGSGSTYVIGSKIAQWWQQLQGHLDALESDAVTTPAEDEKARWQLVVGLPRSGTDVELFMALARRTGVLNNFRELTPVPQATAAAFAPVIEPVWRPDEIRQAVLQRHPEITGEEFDLSVIDAGSLDQKTKHRPASFDEYLAWLQRVVKFAEAYEPFYEKAFEIWRRGRDALVRFQ